MPLGRTSVRRRRWLALILLSSWSIFVPDKIGIARSWTFKKRSYLFIPPQLFAKNSAYLAKGDSAVIDTLVERFWKSLPEQRLVTGVVLTSFQKFIFSTELFPYLTY
ncbi:hypothetical protein [Planctobacterium marinum]|uniref:hypothetical protein n=1 Tax=Planctobacterium marinum TaxID=1631968 RepID=UPI0030C71F69